MKKKLFIILCLGTGFQLNSISSSLSSGLMLGGALAAGAAETAERVNESVEEAEAVATWCIPRDPKIGEVVHEDCWTKHTSAKDPEVVSFCNKNPEVAGCFKRNSKGQLFCEDYEKHNGVKFNESIPCNS